MIAYNHNTALLLQAQEGAVQPVLYDGDAGELKRMLGCDTVCFVMLGERLGVFFPDETESRFGFSVEYAKGGCIVFRGSGLIVGDEDGKTPLKINFRDLTIKSIEYGSSEEES